MEANDILKQAAERAEIRDILGKNLGTEGEGRLTAINKVMLDQIFKEKKERGL
jgi:hypothetical protein